MGIEQNYQFTYNSMIVSARAVKIYGGVDVWLRSFRILFLYRLIGQLHALTALQQGK